MSAADEAQTTTIKETKYDFENEGVGSTKKLFICAIAANLASFCCGVIISWASPAQGQLTDKNPPFESTDEQQSWITGLMSLGAFVGPIIAGFSSDKIGRQKSLLIISVPLLISWIVLAATYNIGAIYFARIVAGICVGWIFTVIPMYIGEISTNEVRGALGSFMQLFISLGILYIYAIGPYVSWVWFQVVGLITPCLFALVFFWMPESPYYYAAKDNKEGALKALAWLRGKTQSGVEAEYNDIKENVEESFKTKSSVKDLWATKGNRKALVISLGLVGLQQFSGINVVLMYTSSIFSQAAGGGEDGDGGLSSAVSTIIVGAVMLLASGVTPLVVDRLGRRALLILSGVGMCIAQVILGTCFYLLEKNGPDPKIAFLPILAVILYISAYSIGFGPLPWAVMGEIFPPNIKSTASTLTASFCWFLGFLITKFYPNINKAIGPDASFWMFAGFCALACVFVAILLPETKGKGLDEIQDILNK